MVGYTISLVTAAPKGFIYHCRDSPPYILGCSSHKWSGLLLCEAALNIHLYPVCPAVHVSHVHPSLWVEHHYVARSGCNNAGVVCVCVCVCVCCWSAWSATLHQRVAGQFGVLHCTNELLVSLERTAISTLKQLQLGKHPLKKSLECISQSSTSKLGYLCMYTCSVVTVIPKCGQAYEGTSLLYGYRGFQVG